MFRNRNHDLPDPAGDGMPPLHASAFTYAGCGVLVAGAAGGGKTGLLLAFAARGGGFIGDEAVYVGADGGLRGLPEPITVRGRYLRDLPALRARVGRGARARLWALALLERLARAAGAERIARALRNRQCVRIAPERLLGAAACAYAGPLDVALFLVPSDRPEITLESVAPQTLAGRMLAAPAEAREAARLRRALAGKRAFLVRLPPGIALPDLFAAVVPALDAHGSCSEERTCSLSR